METIGDRFRRLMEELGINGSGEGTINPVKMNVTIRIKSVSYTHLTLPTNSRV